MASTGRTIKRRDRHGKSDTKAYHVWASMIARCTNPNDAAFKNYGGRGIGVTDDWRKFRSFYDDMGDPPDGMSLDRIDNDKGYAKENCRWATRETQSRNRRNARLLTAHGKTQLLCDWVRETGISHTTILYRLRKGWPEELAVSAPLVTERKGIPRGKRIVDHQPYGDRHGIRWTEPRRVDA